ncbi:MAG: hypothetical protein ISS18_15980 [Bacteroidales bacterium]|nr:hypothetical protein [Bacteroidales bacterium]
MRLSAKTLLILSLVFLGFAFFSIGFGIAYTWGNDKPFGVFSALNLFFVAVGFLCVFLLMKKKKEEEEKNK